MEKFGGWFQVVGNVGIVVGLVFVGLQLQQDRELKRAELVFSSQMSVIDDWLAVLGEDPASSLTRLALNTDELTERDLVVVDAWLRLDVMRCNTQSLMEEFGVYSGRWRNREPRLHPAWHTEFGQRVFAATSFSGVHPEYRKVLARYMEDAKPERYKEYLERIGGLSSIE